MELAQEPLIARLTAGGGEASNFLYDHLLQKVLYLPFISYGIFFIEQQM